MTAYTAGETRFASFLAKLTAEQAREWNHSNEKTLFVTNLLTDNNFGRASFMVNSVEYVFARLLGFDTLDSCIDHWEATANERAFGC